jgi:hypothetical protein
VTRAWFLNLDADAELEDPSARTPSRAVRARTEALVERLAGLLAPGDTIVADPPEAGVHAGRDGRAWCPTPRALAALTSAGARLPESPPLSVLRRVNHRRFSADMGLALPGARWAETRSELDAALDAPSPTGLWLLRRPFGFAGRGRLRFDPARRDAVCERWIESSFASGEGVEVAPWVERDADFARHGFLARGGAITLGEPTVQRCDDAGAWLASERAGEADLGGGERAALHEATREAAASLAEAGYFGPFGVDAFRFRDARGASRFLARCEINARYSMGWAVGMGDRRPDLEDR